jgi:hypothetical protein
MAVQIVTLARAGLLAFLLGALAGTGAARAQTNDGKPPSTFGPVIGAALLCHDQIDNAYFYRYLQTAFGPPYKHDGGAFWFRTPDAQLWGAQVSEVMVSDDTSELAFLAAVAEVPPDELEQAIRKNAGLAHPAVDASTYPLRISAPGSTIAYYNAKSKIYCAKFKPLPPHR